MEIKIDHSSAVLSMTYRGYEISIADNVTHYSEQCIAVKGCVDIRVFDEDTGDDLTSVVGKIIKSPAPGYIEGKGYILKGVFGAIDKLCDLYLPVKPFINNAK